MSVDSRPVPRWTPWHRETAPDDHRIRVYCFPHAGGSASLYRPMSEKNPYDWFELVPVELPGRGVRRREAPVARMPELVEEFLRFLAGRPETERYALYGHSLGAAVAYEVACRAGARPPLALLVSGAAAPGHGDPIDLHLLPDRELMVRLAELGGTPAELLAEPDLMEAALPVLRADLSLYATNAPVVEPGALRCPVLALGAEDDRMVSPEAVASWSTTTTADFAHRIVPGDHFFVLADERLVPTALAELLAPWADPTAGRA